eukprot:6343806-Amphidinium_carterae.1
MCTGAEQSAAEQTMELPNLDGPHAHRLLCCMRSCLLTMRICFSFGALLHVLQSGSSFCLAMQLFL